MKAIRKWTPTYHYDTCCHSTIEGIGGTEAFRCTAVGACAPLLHHSVKPWASNAICACSWEHGYDKNLLCPLKIHTEQTSWRKCLQHLPPPSSWMFSWLEWQPHRIECNRRFAPDLTTNQKLYPSMCKVQLQSTMDETQTHTSSRLQPCQG